MANIKSAQKRVRQTEKKSAVNLARRTSVKTALKKVHVALKDGVEVAQVQDLLIAAQVKLARAKSKGVLHPNTASRKLSRLAKKVARETK
jgi:small subunit ribosomal protein S20